MMVQSYVEKIREFEDLGEEEVQTRVDNGAYAHKNLRWAKTWLAQKKRARDRNEQRADNRRANIALWIAGGSLALSFLSLLVSAIAFSQR